MSDPRDGELQVADEVELEIGAVAHGGMCVARHDGRVVFVRYALPGERARVRITEARPGSFCRGEAIEILRADPRRVSPPCVHFGPGGCGGCDWQHASAELQRDLKAAVVEEQLRRLAGMDMTVTVEPLPGGGLGWRSRVRWAVRGAPGGGVDTAGEGVDPGEIAIGPRRYRSHDVVPITAAAPCLIAADGLSEAGATRMPPTGADEVALVHGADARPTATFLSGGRPLPDELTGAAPATVREVVRDRIFRVAAAGFWQAHRDAARVLSDAVAAALADHDLTGRDTWDLYGGVGLFAAVLAERVGAGGTVVSVESDPAASEWAARNLADLPQARAVAERAERFLAAAPDHVDAVVLDPPRSGAGRAVCQAIADRGPGVMVYVACDPAALARDTAALLGAGYHLGSLRAFDAFPQTHHIECVAVFSPAP